MKYMIKYDRIETRVLSLSEVTYCDTDIDSNIISDRVTTQTNTLLHQIVFVQRIGAVLRVH